MSGNEIITIHLGPYANYVGAFLANQEHYTVFGTSTPYSSSQYTSRENQSNSTNNEENMASICENVDCTILFQPSKGSRSSDQTRSTSSSNTYYIPRAIYCDFEGAIPIHHANSIATQNFKQSQKNAQKNAQRESNYDPLMFYEDSFSSYQSLYHSSSNSANSANARNKANESTGNELISHEHLYWHNILYPHLRPMTNCPENVILTSAPHVLGISGDVFTEATTILNKPVSSTSFKHEDTFGETLFNQFRLMIEKSEQSQGCRILFDSTSIWGGVAYILLQHIMNEYSALNVILVSVSTPFSIDNATTSFPAELFAAQSYQIPYSPFTTTIEQLTHPLAIKQHTLQLREKRLLNTSIFTSNLPQFDKCCYIPLTFPLSSSLQQFISTKIPMLVQRYQHQMKVNKEQRNLSTSTPTAQSILKTQQDQNQTMLSIPSELQTTVTSLSQAVQQFKGVLFQFLTSPHFALALFPLFQSLYLLKSTSSSRTTLSTTVSSLSELLNTIRPRSSLALATLAHQHHPQLLSQSILNETTSYSLSPQNQSLLGADNKHLFPTLDLPHHITATSIPILSNLYQSFHEKQVKIHQRQMKQADLVQGGHQTGNNSQNSNNDTSPSSNFYQDLFAPEDEYDIDPQRAQDHASIKIGSNVTINHFDIDTTLASTTSSANSTAAANKNAVINGVFQHTNALQYEYECQQRFKATQRDLYSFFSLTKPSTFYIFPHLLQPTPYTPHLFYTPTQLQGYSNIGQLFYAKPSTISSVTTNDVSSSNSQYKSYESLTTAFISPQLSDSMQLMANNFKRMEKQSIRQQFYGDIENDDWVENYHTLANLGLEYKEVDVYTLDEGFLD